MFPYPSGDGLHVGHPKGYIATDIYSRMKKMQGYNVIHPMGWDAFGLPAEQYALKNKVHPKIATKKNIANFKSQLAKINFDYDWDREISTTDPKFYKWTQWIFKQLYKKGLAYESYEPINWCPSCKTGLANEDLDGNACERCGTVVEKKPLRQWNLKITKYADRLIDDLDTLTTWPEHVKTAQRNWIGRSEGAEIEFKIKEVYKNISFKSKFTIFTTRADTLFGCTYTVLAPEHNLVKELLEDKDNKNILQNKEEVKKYIEAVKTKTDIERSAEGKEKTGVKLEGVMAINPANQKEVPVYIADYVLASYGTGAIMAVPAHDERDKKFAELFSIPIHHVVAPLLISPDITNNTTTVLKKKKKIVALLRNKDGKFLVVDWGHLYGGKLFLGGTVEDGETSVQTAIREIREETGYTDVKVIYSPDDHYVYKYFAPSKNIYFEADTQFVLLDLISEKKEKTSLEKDEIDKFSISFESGEDLIKETLSPLHVAAYKCLIKNEMLVSDSILFNSAEFDGMNSEEARIKITEYVGGKIVKKYKLRDWVFARQRYWGEPFPVVYATKKVFGVHIEGSIKRDRVAVVIIKDGKVLCEKLNTTQTKFNGQYLLIGGGIEANENIEQALKREVSEELGIDDFKIISNLGVFEQNWKSKTRSENRTHDHHIFHIELDNNKIKETTDQAELIWVDLEEFILDCKNNDKNDQAFAVEKILAPDTIFYGKIERDQSVAPIMVADSELPILLPEVESYESTGTGESPLANIKSFTDVYGYINQEGEFESVKDIKNNNLRNIFEIKLFKRESNTMPQWAGSSWYWLRFLDPHNDTMMIDPDIEKAWPQVDLYVGGDHATRHLIYARFWHKFLYDIGVVSHIEPFKRLEFLGFILASDGSKMSKSKGNIINPDDVVDEYGADTFRLYEMFMAPFEATAVWNTNSIKGVKRFLERVEKMKANIFKEGKSTKKIQNILHQTIKKVGEDIENFKFNTAVSQMMICMNNFEDESVSGDDFDKFMTILAPFAPTLCREYLSRPWPTYDAVYLMSDTVEIALQINGKLRSTMIIKNDLDDESIKNLLKENDIYKKYIIDINGNSIEPKKIIVIKNKVVNVVL